MCYFFSGLPGLCCCCCSADSIIFIMPIVASLFIQLKTAAAAEKGLGAMRRSSRCCKAVCFRRLNSSCCDTSSCGFQQKTRIFTCVRRREGEGDETLFLTEPIYAQRRRSSLDVTQTLFDRRRARRRRMSDCLCSVIKKSWLWLFCGSLSTLLLLPAATALALF